MKVKNMKAGDVVPTELAKLHGLSGGVWHVVEVSLDGSVLVSNEVASTVLAPERGFFARLKAVFA